MKSVILRIGAIAFILIGCNRDIQDDSPTATPEVTDQQPIIVVTLAGTPEPNAVISSDGDYYVAVSYAQEVENPPNGKRQIIITATLANTGGETVEVAPEHLILVDTNDKRYAPETPDQDTNPALVDTKLLQGASVYGFVKYTLPMDATPKLLEWCPGGTCSLALRSVVP